MIRFQPATPGDVAALTDASKRAFDHDVDYGAPGPGGPPGYDSQEFYRRVFRWGKLFKIVDGTEVIGGIIVQIVKPGHCELSRMWLVPERQNQRVGRQALRWVEETFPAARRWTLDTPAWNQRTQHVYEAMGYVKVGTRPPDLVLYEKRV